MADIDYIDSGQEWTNTSGTDLTCPTTGVVLKSGVTATWTGEAWDISQSSLAAADAAAAMVDLSAMSNDTILTPQEKKKLLADWTVVYSEKSGLLSQAATYPSISTTAYTAAWQNLATYLNGGTTYLSGTPAWIGTSIATKTTVVGSTFRSTFQAYYDAKISLLKLVSDEAGKTALWSSVTGDSRPVDGATRNEMKGVWVAGTVYKLNDIVYLNGSSYTCLANNTITSPEVSGWAPLATKGLDGLVGQDGLTGVNGVDATRYTVLNSAASINRSPAGVTSPAAVTYTCQKTVGLLDAVSFQGFWKIAKSDNGNTFTSIYESTAAESQRSVPIPSGVKAIRARVYLTATSNIPLGEEMSVITDDGVKGETGLAGKAATRIYQKTLTAATDPAKPTQTAMGVPAGWSDSAFVVESGYKQWQCDGIVNYATLTVEWGTPYLSLFKVDTLEAFQVNTGSLTSAANGVRLTINEKISGNYTHEFRNYSSSGTVVSSMGDTGTSSNEQLFYADLSSVSTISSSTISHISGYYCKLPSVAATAADAHSFGVVIEGGDSSMSTQLFQQFRGSDGGKSWKAMSWNIGSCVGLIGLSSKDPSNTVFEIGATFSGNSKTVSMGTPTEALLVSGKSTLNGDVAVTGSVVASGNVSAYSDRRLKTNIRVLENPLDTIEKISGYNFDWIKDDKPDVGLIADEIKAIYPMAITEMDGFDAVCYTKIIPLLIESIKELKRELASIRLNQSK